MYSRKLYIAITFAVAITLSSGASAKEFLTASQATDILNRLDDDSSDSIDEGECELSYNKISCDDSTQKCTVAYTERCFDNKTNDVGPDSAPKYCSFEIGKTRSSEEIESMAYARFFDAKCN